MKHFLYFRVKLNHFSLKYKYLFILLKSSQKTVLKKEHFLRQHILNKGKMADYHFFFSSSCGRYMYGLCSKFLDAQTESVFVKLKFNFGTLYSKTVICRTALSGLKSYLKTL